MSLKRDISYRIAVKVRPQIRRMEGRQQLQAVRELIPAIYLSPFAAVGLIWLLLVTDYELLLRNLDHRLVLSVALLLLLLQPFTIQLRLGAGDKIEITSSLAPVVLWAAVLISGPTGLWAMVLAAITAAIWQVRSIGQYSESPFWEPASRFVQEMSSSVFAPLVALTMYVATGGTFPHSGAELANWLPAFYAIIISGLLSGVLLLPVAAQSNRLVGAPNRMGSLARFYVGAVALPLIMSPFAILISILFAEGRLVALIFMLIGIYLVNRLAHYLSKVNQLSRQQAIEFAQLQLLGEALIQAPADGTTLPAALTRNVPNIFPVERVEIRLFDTQQEEAWSAFRVSRPESMEPVSGDVWKQLEQSESGYLEFSDVVLAGDRRPYGDALAVKIYIERPEREGDALVYIGGVYVLRHKSVGKVMDSLAAIRSLANQISSAVFRAEVHAETLALHKMEQELSFAGHVQASFLPESVPELEGWQIAATIEPARQTSGDFYDFVPLDNGRLGILVADVSDKGTGAALYMALSRTLIQTHAMQHGDQPEIALALANDRILADTQSEQFVTAFYGIIDSSSGRFTYVNAGHNPPYLLRAGDGEQVEALTRTGIPMGMFEASEWEQMQVQLEPGDVLLLYTDGVTEAQNAAQELFDDGRLLATGKAHKTRSAEEIRDAIIDSIHEFVGGADQFDDVTLMVVARSV